MYSQHPPPPYYHPRQQRLLAGQHMDAPPKVMGHTGQPQHFATLDRNRTYTPMRSPDAHPRHIVHREGDYQSIWEVKHPAQIQAQLGPLPDTPRSNYPTLELEGRHRIQDTGAEDDSGLGGGEEFSYPPPSEEARDRQIPEFNTFRPHRRGRCPPTVTIPPRSRSQDALDCRTPGEAGTTPPFYFELEQSNNPQVPSPPLMMVAQDGANVMTNVAELGTLNRAQHTGNA